MKLTDALTLALCLTLTACATRSPETGKGGEPGAGTAGAAVQRPSSSPECLAAKLRPAEPFSANALPNDPLLKRQSGWVAVRYDVAAGKATNVAVAASQPAGLYDSYVLQHAQRYRDSGGNMVKGCVMTIDVKF